MTAAALGALAARVDPVGAFEAVTLAGAACRGEAFGAAALAADGFAGVDVVADALAGDALVGVDFGAAALAGVDFWAAALAGDAFAPGVGFTAGFDAALVAADAAVAFFPACAGSALAAVAFVGCAFAGCALAGVLVGVRGGVFTATIRFLPGLAQPASPACG
jgi:hypothetical protein